MSSAIPPPLATLRLYSDSLDPSYVDGVIKLNPDVAAMAGGTFGRTANGTSVGARTGTWFISTKGRDLGQRAEVHLRWIVNIAQNHLSELKNKIPDIKADLSLLVHDSDFSPSKDLSHSLVERATSIGELEVEVPAKAIDVVVDHTTYQSLFKYP